jgi:uncharacterized protein YbaP (TraB family)
MIKRLIFFLIALLNIAGVVAQTKKKTTAKKNAAAVNAFQLEKTLLWEISGNGLTKSSYLFGTMHMLCAKDALLSDSLRYAIASSKEVYFEVDLDNFMETLGAMSYMNMKGNKTLSDFLTPEEYTRVKDYFKNGKSLLPLNMMERMKPYFITAMISESKFPCAEKDGMEMVIMKEAKKQNKNIKGLESIKYQASIFDSIPYDKQAKELVMLIDSANANKGKPANNDSDYQLLDVYRNQDIDKMIELTSAEESMKQYLDILLWNRNANWVQKMPTLMKENTLLFAVGAGHLGGEKGVIQLLRKAGYTVRPVTHKPAIEKEVI